MGATWDQAARERAYTALCEAVTATGREGESLFLARLVLLLGERLSDGATFEACLATASAPNRASAPHPGTRNPPSA